jgi:hypothetical protein
LYTIDKDLFKALKFAETKDASRTGEMPCFTDIKMGYTKIQIMKMMIKLLKLVKVYDKETKKYDLNRS